MTRLSFLVIAALAGCYSPGVQPCALACSANRECPDGLTCNGQNACAATSTSMCNELPIDAPDSDAARTSVTVEVRDVAGGPVPAALVVFTDAAGALVAEMPTGVDGTATIDLPAGGGATVVRMVPRLNGTPGNDFDVVTYLDLWPGAYLITQAQLDPTIREVTVDFTPPPGTAQYAVLTSCAQPTFSSVRPIKVLVPRRCKQFDVFVFAGSTTVNSPTHAAVLPAQSSTSITVAVDEFKPTRSVLGTLTGVPSGVNRLFGATPWVTPTAPAPALGPQTMMPIPNGGMINPLSMPVNAGVATTLAAHYQALAGGPASLQLVHDRFPPSAATVDRDYSGVILPWMGTPSLDFATRQMAWPVVTPAGVATNPPSFFAATARYNHDPSSDVTWRLYGAPPRIVQSGNLKAVTFPDIPGDQPFEPVSVSSSISSSVTLFQVAPQAERQVIEAVDIAGSDGLHKYPALRHITISISQ